MGDKTPDWQKSLEDLLQVGGGDFPPPGLDPP